MDSGDGFCGWFKDRQGSAMINFKKFVEASRKLVEASG